MNSFIVRNTGRVRKLLLQDSVVLGRKRTGIKEMPKDEKSKRTKEADVDGIICRR